MPTTPKTSTRAAIYARISLDAEGDGKGVKRQIADCRKLADDLGWKVVDEYVDNDISAYSGKRRPGYERMLDDMRAGALDGVVIYNHDRLTRQPIEFEQFYAIASKAGILLRSVTGDTDLGTDDGLFIGRLYAAVAAKESGAKSRRQKRKNVERAQAGLPHGGSRRPFGFENDRITHKSDDVAIIRHLVERYLAGESCLSLARWLDAEGVRTVAGVRWKSNVVRQVITNPRTAGLRTLRGEIVGPAVWEPIISPTVRDQVIALHESNKATGRRSPHRYLLSGLLRCSLCGGILYSQSRQSIRRYVCQSGPDHGGCGKITIVAPPVEQLLSDAVIYRLDTPELADALDGRGRADDINASLMESLSADREQLEQLAIAHGNRQISMSEWLAARKPIQPRIRAAERQLRRATNSTQLAGLVGQGTALAHQWAGLNLVRQAAIVGAVLDHAAIQPGVRGVRAVDPQRVTPVWRL